MKTIQFLSLFLFLIQSALADEKATEPKGVLPYDLAFDPIGIPLYEQLAVSFNSNLLAYTVYKRTTGDSVMFKFVKGTPGYYVGARIHITDLEKGTTERICPTAGNTWSPSWSPDGEVLAFYADGDGAPQLWVYEANQEACHQMGSDMFTGMYGDVPKWDPKGQTLYVMVDPKPNAATPADQVDDNLAQKKEPTVRIYQAGDDAESENLQTSSSQRRGRAIAAIDILTGEQEVLVPVDTDFHPASFRLSASGRWLSILSHAQQESMAGDYFKDLAFVSSTGGDVQVMAEGLLALWGEGMYRYNYRWHPSKDKLVYWKDGEIWSVDFNSKGPSAPRRIAPDLGELDKKVYCFTRDGKAVVVGINPGQQYSGPQELAIVPLNRGKPTRVTFDADRWQFVKIIKANPRVIWQPDGRSITLQMREKSTGEKAIVRINLATGTQKVLWKGYSQFGGLTQNNLIADKDHKFLFSLYEDLNTSGDIYRFSGDFSRKDRISTIDSRLDNVRASMAEVIETTVPTHDGGLEKIRTGILLPEGAQRGDSLPAIVMVYGNRDLSENIEVFGGGAGTQHLICYFPAEGTL